jgi:hypothetical protein
MSFISGMKKLYNGLELMKQAEIEKLDSHKEFLSKGIYSLTLDKHKEL